MRPDFAKVLVERERRRSFLRFKDIRHKKRFNPADLEEAYTKQGMRYPHRAYHGEYKELNENLNPLKNFLNRSVGRPWNKVYAELSEHINVRNAVQLHIRQHLDSFVTLHTYKDEHGQLWRDVGYVWRQQFRDGDLYVNQAGILCRYKERTHKKLKLKKGEKLFTVYAEAKQKEINLDPASTRDRYYADIKIVLASEFKELPITPKRHEIFTFVAGSRDIFEKVLALPEVRSWSRITIVRGE